MAELVMMPNSTLRNALMMAADEVAKEALADGGEILGFIICVQTTEAAHVAQAENLGSHDD